MLINNPKKIMKLYTFKLTDVLALGTINNPAKNTTIAKTVISFPNRTNEN